MDLELRHLLGYARRWWWLLLLLPLLVGGLANYLISQQLPLYSASATLLIQPATRSGGGTDVGSLYYGQQLAATYQQLVVTEPVLSPIAMRLGPPYSTGALAGMVSAGVVANTQLLRISASDTSPEQAAVIANTAAAEFQNFISQQERIETSSAQAGLQDLINATTLQIEDIRADILVLEGAGSLDATSESQLASLRQRLVLTEGSLSEYLVQLQDLVLEASSFENEARVWVPAAVPGGAYAPRVLFYTILGLFMGSIIAVGTVGLLEYLDNTVKPSMDFQAKFGAPLMSVVPSVQKLRSGADQVFVLSHPHSNSAESLRLLRTNIEFAAASREIASMTISSAVPGEGKSTITANLAVTMAQSGFTVAVIDADLRRPSQHKFFGLTNRVGLTTLLTHPAMPWTAAATEVAPNLWLISSGPPPPNPADLLGSDRFRDLLRDLQETVDIVIVDTPPVLAVTDPLIVSTMTDGVLLITKADSTRTDLVERAIGMFPESVRRIGIVINQQQRALSSSYYYYGDYQPEPSRDGPEKIALSALNGHAPEAVTPLRGLAARGEETPG